MYFERIVLPTITEEWEKSIQDRMAKKDNKFDEDPLKKDFWFFSEYMNYTVTKQWIKENRPYYRLYPGVLDFLMELDIRKLSQLDLSILPMELTTLEIEIPKAYWSLIGMRSCVIYTFGNVADLVVAIVSNVEEFEDGCQNWLILMRQKDLLLDAEATALRRNPNLPYESLSAERECNIRKLIYGVLAIGDNPDIVKPIVLSKDRPKFERTLDEKYIAKARRRGVFGFDVGKDVPTKEEFACMVKENAIAEREGRVRPHIRMAHLALYHTGKGGSVPKILLRKESMVNKALLEKITKMPQGYYGKEDVENKEK